MSIRERADLIFVGAIGFLLLLIFSFTALAFSEEKPSELVGTVGLVLAMGYAIRWLVKRDQQMRDKLDAQNKNIIEQQQARIAELNAEIKELRKQNKTN